MEPAWGFQLASDCRNYLVVIYLFQASSEKEVHFRLQFPPGQIDGVKLIEHATDAPLERRESKVINEAQSPLQNLRILLVEDGPDNQRLIGFILKKAGAEVTFADNGQIGVDFANAAHLESRPFDVILMDMQNLC